MKARKTPALYQKRDGKWYCTLRGRQRYLGKNLDVAREKLKGLLEGKEGEKQVETLGEFAEAYLASLQNNQSPDTIRTKAVTCRSFREFVGEKSRMGGISITAETIERYKQHGFAEGLKRQTVRSRLLNLSALFEHAVKLGIIRTNPVRQVPRVKASVDPDPDHLTEDEEAKLLALTEDQRYIGKIWGMAPSRKYFSARNRLWIALVEGKGRGQGFISGEAGRSGSSITFRQGRYGRCDGEERWPENGTAKAPVLPAFSGCAKRTFRTSPRAGEASPRTRTGHRGASRSCGVVPRTDCHRPGQRLRRGA